MLIGAALAALLLIGGVVVAFSLIGSNSAEPEVSVQELVRVLGTDCQVGEGELGSGADLVAKAEAYGLERFVADIKGTVTDALWCPDNTVYYVTTDAKAARDLANVGNAALPVTQFGDLVEAASERETLANGAEGRVVAFTWREGMTSEAIDPAYYMSIARYGNVFAVKYTYNTEDSSPPPSIHTVMTTLVTAVDAAKT